eukprot:1160514-Pelagomonas_calceolata.AAC.1
MKQGGGTRQPGMVRFKQQAHLEKVCFRAALVNHATRKECELNDTGVSGGQLVGVTRLEEFMIGGLFPWVTARKR